MNTDLRGERLIFLISQPRAGSTMLQRILWGHPDIHTLSEPWLLLHPLYALREEGIWTEYDASLAGNARQGFIDSLTQGGEHYFEGMRRMYTYLYEQAIEHSGRGRFLDKTPRYYHIIPQIHRLFPNAHFIILLRNPLAVLCSILRTWVRGSWPLLHRFKRDLLSAPERLLEGIETLSDSCTVVHYERLVTDPDTEMRRLCARLGLDFAAEMIEYGEGDSPSWRFGDQLGVRQHTRPEPAAAEKWTQDIENPQIWRLARDYLMFLGQDVLDEMGYAYDDLWRELSDSRPSTIRLVFTWPLWMLVHGLNLSQYGQVAEQRADRVVASLRRHGLTPTCRRIASKMRGIRGNALPDVE